MLCAAVTLYLQERLLTEFVFVFVFVYVCVMVLNRAASDSIRVCAAQSWDYLSHRRVSTVALLVPWHNSGES